MVGLLSAEGRGRGEVGSGWEWFVWDARQEQFLKLFGAGVVRFSRGAGFGLGLESGVEGLDFFERFSVGRSINFRISDLVRRSS